MKFCTSCGEEIRDEAVICPKCGCEQPMAKKVVIDPNASTKDWLTTLLLVIFTGVLGIHRFYVGKTGTGILWLLTGGLLGIGALIDLIQIATGKFTDSQGKVIKKAE